MLEVADIFRQYGSEYLRRFGQAMLPSHRRAFDDLLACRTPALGGHVLVCDQCGRPQYAYHSCRNRHCPKCHGEDTDAWIEARRKELLPVPYFHLVFTLPEELRESIRRHQRIGYGLLMKTAARALMKLAADPHYVGGTVGVLAVLHTWTRTLVYHPHVHCLVPGGGVSRDGRWMPARRRYLVPVKALSRIFRGMFRDAMAKELPDVRVPDAAWKKAWVVYAKPAVQGAEKTLAYLGRYVHRVAITNSRLLAIDNGRVAFRYQRSGEAVWRTLTLEADEFIRRFLQHVLPEGVHKVRYYGLWSPACRGLLRRVQLALAWDAPAALHDPSPPTSEEPRSPHPMEGRPCPCCGHGKLVWAGPLAPQARAPP
jgi:hypothetical protein